METTKTKRGFDVVGFNDINGADCSVQKASVATDDYIWFGIATPELTIFKDEKMGTYLTTEMPKNWRVGSRMLLSKGMVAKLLPMLIKFVETGKLTD